MEVSKNKYSLLGNLGFMLAQTWRVDRMLLVYVIAQIPALVMIPLLTTYLSKYTVQLISEKVSLSLLMQYIVGLSLALLVFNILKELSRAKVEYRSAHVRLSYITLVASKVMRTDYRNMESSEGQDKMQKAVATLPSGDSGLQQVFAQLIRIGSSVIGLVVYSLLMIRFNAWLVMILFALSLLSFVIHRGYNHWVHKNRDHWTPIDRKINYLTNKAGEQQVAKDIRLFNMSGWLEKLFMDFFLQRKAWHHRTEHYHFIVESLGHLSSFVRDGLAYLFLLYQVSQGRLTLAEFIFYFGLIANYSKWIFEMMFAFAKLQRMSLGTTNLREFLDMPDQERPLASQTLDNSAPTITFDQVTFRYQEGERNILDNVSFSIKAGEKLALVGLNGAGKTTLVKLLCGLYQPISGEIKINGHSLSSYDRDAYFEALSVVFQDIHLLPITIEENISLVHHNALDKEKFHQVIEQADLAEKINALPKKEATLLMKGVHDEAIELSGGQQQKLALARALYKGGSILILDEPTAALDPIAESEIYQHYQAMAHDKTSLFISHRLASTAFCDRILLLENGKIVEEGSHAELLAKQGQYYDLFMVQSQYYQEESAKNE